MYYKLRYVFNFKPIYSILILVAKDTNLSKYHGRYITYIAFSVSNKG